MIYIDWDQIRERYNETCGTEYNDHIEMVSDIYRSGMGMHDMAEMFGVSVSPVIKILEYGHIERRRNGYVHQRVKNIRTFLLENKFADEHTIAEKFSVSVLFARQLVKKYRW